MAQPLDASVANQPNNVGAVPRLLEELGNLHQDLEVGSKTARHDMYMKARSLLLSLITPRELMIQHTWADVCFLSRSWPSKLFTYCADRDFL